MPLVLPQPQSANSGSISASLDASVEPQAQMIPIPMMMGDPRGGTTYDFVGVYFAVCHVYGRHKGVEAEGGQVVVSLTGNGVSDDGGKFPDASSDDWRFFDKTIVGYTSRVSDDPAAWTLDLSLATGHLEIQAVSLIVWSVELP
jgi:hypothetical protein